jgi:hypothetical protein
MLTASRFDEFPDIWVTGQTLRPQEDQQWRGTTRQVYLGDGGAG